MTTEAGRRLLTFLAKQRGNDTDSQAWRNGVQYAEECVAMSLPKVEAEARAALLAELEAGVAGLPATERTLYAPERRVYDVDRAAVLDLIREAGGT